MNGDGFSLTDAANGVLFDISGNGFSERIAWTAAVSDDAWLVLDHNGNGTIDNRTELFGNFTAQPMPAPGTERNGSLALGEYDRPTNGGNGDGQITMADAIFASLRLWCDTNHNGRSEASELMRLQIVGIDSLDLDYKLSRRLDRFGNQFRYRAKIQDSQGQQLGRWAWDVFLASFR